MSSLSSTRSSLPGAGASPTRSTSGGCCGVPAFTLREELSSPILAPGGFPMTSRGGPHPATEYQLDQRWPSPRLSASYRALLGVFRRSYGRHLARGSAPVAALREAYGLICRCMRESRTEAGGTGAGRTAAGRERFEIEAILREARRAHGQDWLQAFASLLAMLMHFTPDDNGAHPL